jgi:hypothetical protein
VGGRNNHAPHCNGRDVNYDRDAVGRVGAFAKVETL